MFVFCTCFICESLRFFVTITLPVFKRTTSNFAKFAMTCLCVESSLNDGCNSVGNVIVNPSLILSISFTACCWLSCGMCSITSLHQTHLKYLSGNICKSVAFITASTLGEGFMSAQISCSQRFFRMFL